jgi:hypothetical protein
MPNILRRPMFRGGVAKIQKEGIASHSLARKGYAGGDLVDDEDTSTSDSGITKAGSIDPSVLKAVPGYVTAVKSVLPPQSDGLSKFLINFGTNLMGMPGGRNILQTAALASKEPTKELYADIDKNRQMDAAIALKAIGALSKGDAILLEKKAKFFAQNIKAKNPEMSDEAALRQGREMASQSELYRKDLSPEQEKKRYIEEKSKYYTTEKRKAPAVADRVAGFLYDKEKGNYSPYVQSSELAKKITDEDFQIGNEYLNPGDVTASTDRKELTVKKQGDLKDYEPNKLYFDPQTKRLYRFNGQKFIIQ